MTTQDPDANLVKAGFTSNPGVARIENLLAACKMGHGGSQVTLNLGMAAMTTSEVGAASLRCLRPRARQAPSGLREKLGEAQDVFSAKGGPVNSASMTIFTSSPTPMVVPGAGMP